MKIGDVVFRQPHMYCTDARMYEFPVEEAKVVYVHPRGRFHTVQFKKTGFRESYRGIAMKNSKDI